MISRILNDGPDASGDESVEDGLKEIFRNLPNVNTIFYTPLRKTRKAIKQQIRDMRRLYKTIIKEIKTKNPTYVQAAQQMKSNTWKVDIEKIFKDKCSALLDIYSDIEEIIKIVDETSVLINRDWERDVAQIWDDESHLHRPKQKKQSA